MNKLALSRSPVFASKGNTYGTSSTPTEANAIISYGLEITDTGEEVEMQQDDMKPGRSNLPHVYDRGRNFTFSSYLNGSGVLGTPPGYNILFRACGMNQTIQAGVSTTLALMDPQNAQEWIDLAGFRGRTRMEAAGSRGTWTLTMNSGEFSSIQWEFQGLYADPTEPGLPGAPTFTAQTSPVLVDSIGTPTFTVGGYAADVSAFTISIGNEITGGDRAGGVKQRLIVNRTITAEITMRAPLFADFQVFQRHTSRAEDALQIIHGPATRRTTLSIPKFGYGMATTAAVNGVEFVTFPLHVERDVNTVNDLTILQH